MSVLEELKEDLEDHFDELGDSSDFDESDILLARCKRFLEDIGAITLPSTDIQDPAMEQMNMAGKDFAGIIVNYRLRLAQGGMSLNEMAPLLSNMSTLFWSNELK